MNATARARRLRAELRMAPSAPEARRALLALRFHEEGGSAVIDAREDGEPLDALVTPSGAGGASGAARADDAPRDARFEEVRIEGDRYRRIPSSDARVELLSLARDAARAAVVVHVPIHADRTHLARAALDAPRAAARALLGGAAAAAVPEPGDRFAEGGFVHAFFDEEPLYAEVARAGLGVESRRGFLFRLTRGARDAWGRELADPFALELARASRLVAAAERARAGDPPERALARMRELGARAVRRGPIGRARLRRAIGWVDALSRTGPNCYRRTLLELALDRGAAEETVVFGLDVGRTGHVAFKDREELAFDVLFELGPGASEAPGSSRKR